MQELANWLSTAFQQHQAGNLPVAESLYQRILEKEPGHVQALYLLGTLNAQRGDTPSAILLLRQAITIDPNSVDAQANLGNALYEQGEYDEAAVCYRQAISINPGLSYAHYGLGKIFQASRNFQAAIDCYERTLTLKPGFLDAHVNLGAVLKQKGHLERAEECYRRALSINSNSPNILCYLGATLSEQQKFDEAQSYYTQAIAINPQHTAAYRGLGDLFRAQEKLDEALPHYQKAVEIDPSSVGTQIKLGYALLVTGSEKKLELLKLLSQDYIFPEIHKPKDLAIRLARLYSYTDQAAREQLCNLFSEFDPGRLYPSEWWRTALQRFGSSELAHDKIARGVLSAVYSWSIPTQEVLDEIARFAKDSRVFSYGSGAGYWEYLLKTHYGIEVAASDRKLRHRFLDMQQVDYAEARVHPADIVFLAWIPEGASDTENILSQMREGQKLVLIGESIKTPGLARTCATDRFFSILQSEFKHLGTCSLVQFAYFYDSVEFYEKKSNNNIPMPS